MINVTMNEIYKLFARKRIHAFMGIILVISLFILAGALITGNIFAPAPLKGSADMGGRVANALSADYGQTFALRLFDGIAGFAMPLIIIVLVTSLVTDEFADGSLKLPLLRQVSRVRLLSAKAAAMAVVLIILLVFLLMLGYGFGAALLGWGDQFVLRGKILTPSQGVIFTLTTYGVSLISYFSFGMVMMLFAVILSNSGSVVGIGVGILVGSMLVEQVLPEASLYMISSYFNTYKLLASGMDIREIITGFMIISAYGICSFALSAAIFKKKDLLF